jgi:4-amino-4-deoxy-L-arabinose transferase-like glycosyltransferase
MTSKRKGLTGSAEDFFEPDGHARYCAVKNTSSALFFVGAFLLTALGGWIGLHKAVSSPVWLIVAFQIVVIAGLLKMMVDFKCLRERIAFAIVILIIATAQVERIAPSIFGSYIRTERLGRLVFSLAGLALSLSMLVQSARSGPVPDAASH